MAATAISTEVHNQAVGRLRISGRQHTAYIVAAGVAYATLVYLSVRHHEPWADESQAWLIARDASLAQIWAKIASLEGTPALWHSLLHGLIRLGMPYSGLNIVSGLLGTLGALVFLKLAPFPLPLRICTIFTYFLCFQYAVVARNYSLVPPLLFSIAAAYRQRANVLMAGTLLVLLASASVHACLISAGLATLFIVRYARQWRVITPGNQKEIFIVASVYVIAIALIVLAVWPHQDAMFVITPNWSFANFCGIVRYAFNQAFGPGYWPIVIIGLSLPTLWRGPGLLFFAYSALSLCILGSVIYSNVWHHGFLLLAWLVALWLSIDSGKVRWGAYLALALFALLQCRWTWYAIRYDWSNQYSGSRAMAAYLRQRHLETASIFAIGFPTVAIQPYFPSNLFANYEGHPTQRAFWLWSKQNHTNDSIESLSSRHPEYVLIGYSNEGDARLWRYIVTTSGYHHLANETGATFWEAHSLQPESYEIFQAGDRLKDTTLRSDLDLSQPGENVQLLWGFSENPTAGGRWMDANSGLILQRPPIVNGTAEFSADFMVPATQIKNLGPLMLTISVCGHRLRPVVLDHPGRYHYTDSLSNADLFWAMVPVSLQFEKRGFGTGILKSQNVALVNRLAVLPK